MASHPIHNLGSAPETVIGNVNIRYIMNITILLVFAINIEPFTCKRANYFCLFFFEVSVGYRIYFNVIKSKITQIWQS